MNPPETTVRSYILRSMDIDPLDRMRERIEQCHRLAGMVHQEEARTMLLRMAKEGEADLRRLLEERSVRDLRS